MHMSPHGPLNVSGLSPEDPDGPELIEYYFGSNWIPTPSPTPKNCPQCESREFSFYERLNSMTKTLTWLVLVGLVLISFTLRPFRQFPIPTVEDLKNPGCLQRNAK